MKYFIDPDVNAQAYARNMNITFTIGDTVSGGPTVDITLPYSSFNLTATVNPATGETMPYFPLRPASNSSQIILGRAFFQEAYVYSSYSSSELTVSRYLIANYEHGNFSISQATTGNTAKAEIVPIPAASPSSIGKSPVPPSIAPTPSSTASPGLSQEAKAGIIAGTTAAVAISFFVLALFIMRWRSASRKRKPLVDKSQIQYTFEKQELDGTAFTRPRDYWAEKDSWLEKGLEDVAFGRPRMNSMDKKVELMNYEIVELPDDPMIHEIMSRPQKSWARKGRKLGQRTTYADYLNVKKARDNRMSNGKVSPPISKFCSISCGPIRQKFVNLNRTLPPTPIFRSPRTSRMSSPLSSSRRVPRTPVQNFPHK